MREWRGGREESEGMERSASRVWECVGEERGRERECG